MSEFNYGVYIGRFQPLHIGHEHVIREALAKVETLIICVGSSYQARTPNNPFTFDDRRAMIESVFRHEVSIGRMIITPIRDHSVDATWANGLTEAVNEAVLNHLNKGKIRLHGLNDVKIALAGYGKDASSYYLNMFPDWGSIQLTTQHGTINASDIRHDYLRRLPRMPHDAVSPSVFAFLKGYTLSEEFKVTVAEVDAYAEGKKTYGTGPFLAADVLLEHRGKILLVTRGKAIGRGLLATPGGFLEKNETFLEAAYRELKEETGLNADCFKDYLVYTQLCDNPHRSLRGRIISMMFLFSLPAEMEVPEAVGGDDAAHAGWYDFGDLKSEQFFEDHYTLISNLA